MRRERVGESRRIWIFEAVIPKILAETCGDADLERNPGDIPVFIPSFSDLP
jgi:hypothetical protein